MKINNIIIFYSICFFCITYSYTNANFITFETASEIVTIHSNFMIPIIDYEHTIDIIFFNQDSKIIYPFYPFNPDYTVPKVINEITLKLLLFKHNCKLIQCILYNNVLIEFGTIMRLYFIIDDVNVVNIFDIKQDNINPIYYSPELFEVDVYNKIFNFKDFNNNNKSLVSVSLDNIREIIKKQNINPSYIIIISRYISKILYVTIGYNIYPDCDLDYTRYKYKKIDNTSDMSYDIVNYNNLSVIIMNNNESPDSTLKNIADDLLPRAIDYTSITPKYITSTPSYKIDRSLDYNINKQNNNNNDDEGRKYTTSVPLLYKIDQSLDYNINEQNNNNDDKDRSDYDDESSYIYDDEVITNHTYYSLNNNQFIIFITLIIILVLLHYFIKTVSFFYKSEYINVDKSSIITYKRDPNNFNINMQSFPLPSTPLDKKNSINNDNYSVNNENNIGTVDNYKKNIDNNLDYTCVNTHDYANIH